MAWNNDRPLQHLKFADVVRACREYYDAGMLTAQHSEPRYRECKNNGADGTRCAVATGFSIALLARKGEGSISGIVADGYATVDNLPALAMLQKVHDFWARRGSMVSDTYDNDSAAMVQRQHVYEEIGKLFEELITEVPIDG